MSCGNENSGIYSKHEFTEDLLSITRKQGSCHLITTPNFAYVMTAHVFSNIFIIFIIDPSNIILKWLQLIVRSWLAGWRCGVSGALDRTEYQVVTEWSILHCLLQPQHTPGTTFHLGLVYIFRLKLIIQLHLLLIGSVLWTILVMEGLKVIWSFMMQPCHRWVSLIFLEFYVRCEDWILLTVLALVEYIWSLIFCFVKTFMRIFH